MRPMIVGSDCPAQYPFQSPQAGRHQMFHAAQSLADAGRGREIMPTASSDLAPKSNNSLVHLSLSGVLAGIVRMV